MAGYFGKNVLRRKFGAIKVNENCRKRYNKELMQLFGDLDVRTFISQNISFVLEWSC